MDPSKPSIISSTLRAFFVSIGVILGIGVGFVALAFLIGSGEEVERKTTFKVAADANGERKTLGTSLPVILRINIEGPIGLDGLTTGKIRTLLTESREDVLKDNRVKALLLYIDSPGGTSIDSLNIYLMLKNYKERYNVPIIAYVEGLCASGAMMIAAAADQIVASEGSIIGSVGVVTSPFFNVSDVLKKYDVTALTLTAGKDKDVLNPFRPWKPEEAAPIQGIVDYTYKIFVDIMTSRRPHLDREKLVGEYGADIYPAPVAAEHGYIDHVGYSLEGSIELAVKAANLQDQEYRVVELSSKTWVSDLFQGYLPLQQNKMLHQLEIIPGLHPDLMNKVLLMYLPGAA